MSIEFACHQCQTRLRVRDDAAGRQARCPKCATALVVPQASATAPAVPVTTPIPQVRPSADQPPAFPWSPAPTAPRPAAPEINPYAAPMNLAGMAPAQTPLQGGALDLGVILSKTWDLYIQQKKLGWCILAFFILYLIYQTGTFLATKLLAEVAGMRMPFVAFGIYMVVIVAVLVLQQWVDLGLRMFMLRIARGESPDISQVFRGHPYLLRSSIFVILLVLLFAGLVLALVMVPSMIFGALLRKPEIGTILGWIVWAIPVIYVALVFSQVQFLFVDRNVGLFDAMRMSMQLTRGRLPILLLIYFVLLLAGFSGVLVIAMLTEIAGTSSPLALTVAPIATFPFAMLRMTITYLYLTQQTNELDEE